MKPSSNKIKDEGVAVASRKATDARSSAEGIKQAQEIAKKYTNGRIGLVEEFLRERQESSEN